MNYMLKKLAYTTYSFTDYLIAFENYYIKTKSRVSFETYADILNLTFSLKTIVGVLSIASRQQFKFMHSDSRINAL